MENTVIYKKVVESIGQRNLLKNNTPIHFLNPIQINDFSMDYPLIFHKKIIISYDEYIKNFVSNKINTNSIIYLPTIPSNTKLIIYYYPKNIYFGNTDNYDYNESLILIDLNGNSRVLKKIQFGDIIDPNWGPFILP